MKGIQKAEQVRAKLGKMHVYSSRTRHQQYQNNGSSKPTTNGNMWLGKDRGQQPDVVTSPVKVVGNNHVSTIGRGQWLNAAD